MNILRADHLGMCFGVRDAIALAKSEAARRPVTVLGDLVHNAAVVDDLRERGVRFEHRTEALATPTVMITAHGASDRLLAEVRGRGHTVVEATCPLVHHAHRSLAALVRDGFHPVVIGQRGHVEVRGLTEDHPGCDIILSEDDIEAMAPRPRFGVVSQTTQPVARVRSLVAALRARFPESEVVSRDTVCQPTKQRQQAAEALASRCDVVIVIGGAQSNNTRELVATCARFCDRVHHVQTASDLLEGWFDEAGTIGITAGTSTPDDIIDDVEESLERIAARASRNALVAA